MVDKADLSADAPSSNTAVPDAASAGMTPCALGAGQRRDRIDPKGVIAESYRIDGIDPAECRSIFLDWVLSTDMPHDGPASAIAALLERHGTHCPDHPMTAVLRDGLRDAPRRGRRGGRAARLPR